MNDISEIWARSAELLKDRLNADTFDRWIVDIVPLRLEDGDKAVLGVSNDLFSDWLSTYYSEVINETLESVSGRKLKVVFECGHSPEESPLRQQAIAAAKQLETCPVESEKEAAVAEHIEKRVCVSRSSGFEFSRRFSFDTFVVGDNNQFAHGACQAVADAPGTAYNPLFVHSPVGLGKSHLLQAVAQEVMDRNPNAVVEYVTTEEFSNQYVYALQHNSLPSFRQRIRNVDVLLVDDVQFLGSKTGFQEEFFHTFNALHSNHKQLIMASDRPPQEINGLEKRLVSRFEWGLTVDIQTPDLETRIAILRKKQEAQEIKLEDEVIHFLAASLKSNIRRLEGALTSLILQAKLRQLTHVTVDMAERVLEGILSEEATSQLSIEQIQRVVAEHYDIRFADMTSKRRPANIALPRQVAMYLSRKLTDLSYPNIAERFAKNHATILHAVTTVEEKLATNPDFKREMAVIERKLKS